MIRSRPHKPLRAGSRRSAPVGREAAPPCEHPRSPVRPAPAAREAPVPPHLAPRPGRPGKRGRAAASQTGVAFASALVGLYIGSLLAPVGRAVAPPLPSPPSTPSAPVSPPPPGATADAEAYEALLRDNLRLGALVTALEAETTLTQRELLELELRLLATDTRPPPVAAAPDTDTDTDDPALSYELDPRDVASADEPFDERFADDEGSTPMETDAPRQRFVVSEVPPGSTADGAGLMQGDVLLAIDGRDLVAMEDLLEVDESDARRGPYELSILRDGFQFPVYYNEAPSGLALSIEWVDAGVDRR